LPVGQEQQSGEDNDHRRHTLQTKRLLVQQELDQGSVALLDGKGLWSSKVQNTRASINCKKRGGGVERTQQRQSSRRDAHLVCHCANCRPIPPDPAIILDWSLRRLDTIILASVSPK